MRTPTAHNRRSILRVEELNPRALPAFLDPGFGGLIGDDTLAVTSWLAPDVDVSSDTSSEGESGEETAFDITVALAAEEGFDPAVCYMADFEAEILVVADGEDGPPPEERMFVVDPLPVDDAGEPFYDPAVCYMVDLNPLEAGTEILVADGEDGPPPDEERMFVVDPLPVDDAGEPFYDPAVCYMADLGPVAAEADPVLGDPVPAEEPFFDPAVCYMVGDPATFRGEAVEGEAVEGEAAAAGAPPAEEIDPAVCFVTDFDPAVSEPPTEGADEIPAVVAEIESAEATVYGPAVFESTLIDVAPESEGTPPAFEPAVATDFDPVVLLVAEVPAESPTADAPEADTAPATETELIFVGDLFPVATSPAVEVGGSTTEHAPTRTAEPTPATALTVTEVLSEAEVPTSSEAVAPGFLEVATGLTLGIDGTREVPFVG